MVNEATSRSTPGIHPAPATELFRAALEHLPQGVVLWGLEGQLVQCNSAARNLLGAPGPIDSTEAPPAYELFLSSALVPYPPLERPEARAFRGESVLDAAGYTRHPSRKITTPVSVSAMPLRDALGQFRGVVATFQRRPEDSLASLALEDESSILESILENIGDAGIVAGQDERFLIFNSAARKLLGAPSDLPSSQWPERYGVFLPDQKTAVNADNLPLVRALRGEEVDDMELYLMPPGTARGHWTRATGRPIRDKHGAIKASVVVHRDITERKRSEEKLAQRTLDLERSNQDLEQFAYVASHDLQEPLRMVTGFSRLLAREYQEKLGADAAEYIANITDGAARMRCLIEDLLAYARVGSRGIRLQHTDGEAAFQSALENLALVVLESRAAITHDPIPALHADPTQLVQLFQNLVGNAIKFRSERPLRIHLSMAAHEAEWLFCLRDNGLGFDPRHAERIFLAFQRLNSRRNFSGSGIGLAVCKKVVERHGGRIWATSQPGIGSEFHFTLPMAPPFQAPGRGDVSEDLSS